jgi:DNA-binding NarL/FixJ family response regulator
MVNIFAGGTAMLSAEIAPLVLCVYDLTRREGEVEQHELRGLATHGIASAPSISLLTVQQHLKSIFDKTWVSSRRELVARVFAERHRLMAPNGRV